MHIKFFYFIVLVLWSYAQPKSIVLVDTTDREAYLYQPFIILAQSLGHTVDYKGVDDLIDSTPAELNKKKYDVLLFIFDNEFLGGNGRSYLTTRVLEFVDLCQAQRNKVIGFFFPCFKVVQPNIVQALHFLLGRVGVSYDDCTRATSLPSLIHDETNGDRREKRTFAYLSNTFLLNPLSRRTRQYHTTLSAPVNGVSIDYEQINQVLSKNRQSVRMLPLGHDIPDQHKTLYPYGVYAFDDQTKNHIFIGSKSILNFAGISENIHLCPFDAGVRTWLLDGLRLMIKQLLDIAAHDNHTDVVMHLDKLQHERGHDFALTQGLTTKKFVSTKPQDKIVWMDTDVFGLDDDQAQINQNKLVDHIYRSNLTGLWVTLNPQMFFGRSAKFKSKDKVDAYVQQIKTFARKLKEGALLYKKPLPFVYVGFEIANNLTDDNKPLRYPVDIYENMFHDLPVPLDTSFWDDEIVNPFKTFVNFWNRTPETALIPLAGIIIDLEMYCRKRSSIFTSCMTIDAQTYGKFGLSIKQPTYATISLRDRLLTLINKRQGKSYYRFLTTKAQDLGVHIIRQCNRALSGCRVACYSPVIHSSWFYKGLMKGLATQAQPLKLLTFNSEFAMHADWFNQQKLAVQHSSVIMLSKLRAIDDFGMIDEILSRHHGVWLNKFSRLVEPVTRDWTTIEKTPMGERGISQLTHYLGMI